MIFIFFISYPPGWREQIKWTPFAALGFALTNFLTVPVQFAVVTVATYIFILKSSEGGHPRPDLPAKWNEKDRRRGKVW